ncbi:hypothetical protein TNIN_368411 [Trichonephila inaurata madagascariensis]|uniref:Uncharacterized protein n=1 Tax=Trichonephila inaurata madagascariensis TaxID=2747483 RepID=A0A8X6YX85_9ARAC|nr:hypothetical protein TNIN_368411 [Trichonephila inaurata madagascariensis]
MLKHRCDPKSEGKDIHYLSFFPPKKIPIFIRECFRKSTIGCDFGVFKNAPHVLLVCWCFKRKSPLVLLAVSASNWGAEAFIQSGTAGGKCSARPPSNYVVWLSVHAA